MKKITFLSVLLISALSFGQNGAVDGISTTSNQNVTTRVTNNTVVSFSGEMGRSNASFNGTVYHNPESTRQMPVLAYESGPYFSIAGTPDVSLLEDTTLLMQNYGYGVQVVNDNRIAEDIILADDYDVTSMEFFAYQSFTPTAPPTINEINMQVWDGDPSLPGSSVIYGDATTNVLTSVVWSGAYRQLESGPNTDRAIHRITVDTPGLSLAAGTYWVDWQIGGTATSGPWQPPVAILGQTTTGNGMQSIAGTWGIMEDPGTLTQQGAPIRVMGDCTSCASSATTFTTLGDLEAACPSAVDFTMEDFADSNFGPNSVSACGVELSNAGDGTCYNAGVLEEGFSITVGAGGGGGLTVLLTTGFIGVPSDYVGANSFADFTILNFTGPDDVYSAGFDIFNNSNVDTEIRLFDAGGILIDTFTVTNPINTANFFGFISDVPVSRVEIEGIAGSGELISNLLFGACIENDICTDPFVLTCGDVVAGDTSDNTDQGGANDSLDEWYSFTGTGFEQVVTISLCDGGTAFDSLLTVYDSCGGAVVADNDDSCGLQSEVSFTSDGTSTYYIAVEGFDASEFGAYNLEISCVVPFDNCDIAGSISCGETVVGSTANASPDLGVPDCGGGNDAPGLWYVINDTSGLVTDYTVSLCDGGTTYDSKLVVYSGDCGALVCVAENDDSCGLQSELTFQSDGSSTYYILVNGFNAASSGDFSLNLSCLPVPPFNDMIANSIDVDEAGLPYTDPAVPMPAATTEAGGTPAVCDNAGVLGVWYNFVPELNGTATAEVISPAGYTSVTFYTAPDEDSVETDLTLVDWFDNQCVPGADASIPVVAGQAYYVYVANHDGITDIVIDGDFYLGADDNVIQGFSYFPNPADNQLNLSSGNGTIESAVIYNILGQEVLSQKVGSSNAQLNVAGLTVGTYVLKVVVDGELGIYKIVKQ
ncbi:T9SS type A sorting domain-containing protein [Rasiella rasia]|uniref:T9SS type A sorting domain-containing protein n=1 Tax=Rasiella rasia TaxID=2744027 RepID=A0A6G6GSN3_9FLAO|nr:T9SS type A sorting domain-containing protein [Rasiella rasia]QIE60721.1 T9SS type A sorting domain-containing protein [Rasiella rasia]